MRCSFRFGGSFVPHVLGHCVCATQLFNEAVRFGRRVKVRVRYMYASTVDLINKHNRNLNTRAKVEISNENPYPLIQRYIVSLWSLIEL